MKLKLYTIDNEFIGNLRKFDSSIRLNKGKRVYVGSVFTKNGIDYFVPFTSFDNEKKNNQKIPDNLGVLPMKLINKETGIINVLGGIQFNFMIPIKNRLVLNEVSPNALPTRTIEEKKYRDLIINEIKWLETNTDKVIKKANKYYDRYKQNRIPNIIKYKVNISKLEEEILKK